MEKMFEKATKRKLRFTTARGSLSIEDLWDVPLESRDAFNLDDVAKKIAKELKESSEESYVKPVSSGNTTLELKLELVKHIIKVKLDERAAREKAVEKREKKARILELISRKQDEEMSEKSIEDLQKELDSL